MVIRTEQKRNQLYELIVDLDRGAVLQKDFLEGKHSYIDGAYMQEVEKVCLANDEVQREIKTLDLPAGATVIVEPWAYATDGMNDMSRRTSMVAYCAASVPLCSRLMKRTVLVLHALGRGP